MKSNDPILELKVTVTELAHKNNLARLFHNAANWLSEHPKERILDVTLVTNEDWSRHLYIYHTLRDELTETPF
jgi:hypothetical protein